MSKQHGFSLLELMCVLAILSILAYAGSSQFLSISQQSQNKQTVIASVKSLSEALLQARQLAVASGNISFLCGGISCDGNWSTGFQLSQQNHTLRSVIFPEDLRVSWKGFPTQKQQIEFQPNGLSGYQNGTFEFCLDVWQAALVLNQSGRFYTSKLKRVDEGDCL